MVRNMDWIGIGVLSAMLMGASAAGCSNQSSNPDNTPGAPTPSMNNTTPAPQSNSSGSNRSDDNMHGNHMTGNNMPGRGMGDNMGGTGQPAGPSNHPGMNGTPMSGGGMGGNK